MKSLQSILVACVLSAFTIALRADVTVARDGRSEHVIVLDRDASPSQRRGAAEIQAHLQQMTGATLPIIEAGDSVPEKAIVIGGRHAPPATGLGSEGFAIRTDGQRICIAGSPIRGAMYGCTAFLEKLGVRWFTPAATQVPKRPDLIVPDLNERQVPAFEYREPFFTEAFDKDWAARLRINGNHARLDASTGGKIRYKPFAHSFEALIPPALFAAHPAYFPLIKGKRTSGYVQRCLSNPDVLKLTIERIEQWIKEDPSATLYSVTQNDCYNTCECEKCSEIAKQYGGQSGLYLWFVNQVADAIGKNHPDKLIDTFAYQFTEAPPTGIVPRDNVRIRLCPIAACAAHPFEQCSAPPTVKFLLNLKGWSAITKTLYIWDYNTNFGNYLLPFPDFHEFPAEARLYQKMGVKGVFFQGAYGAGGGGADSEMRAYVMARLLWDPAVDTDALVTEWMQGVYGPAWRPMRSWFDLLHEQVKTPDRHLFIFDRPPVHYLSDAVLKRGDELFDEAQALTETDGQRSQLAKARLWLRYAKLASHPVEGEQLDAFLTDVKKAGIQQLREHDRIDAWEKAYRQRAQQANRPRP